MSKALRPKILLLVEDEQTRSHYRASLETSFDLIHLPSPDLSSLTLAGLAVELIFVDFPSLGAAVLGFIEDVRRELRAKTYVAALVTSDGIEPGLLEESSVADVSCSRAQAATQIRVLVKAGLRIRSTMLELLETNLKLGRVSEKLKKLSLTDELTGLYNMRFMARQIRNEFKRADRYMKQLALILVEIDDFAARSPSWGESVSSQIITQLGQEIGDGIRFEIDYAARSGSADFMLVLPETDLQGALKVAERLRKKVAGTPIEAAGQSLELTASFGVAHFDGQRKNLQNPNELLRVAETGISHAKLHGPNRVYAPQQASASPASQSDQSAS